MCIRDSVKVIRAERKSVESSFPTPLYKKASVEDVYNQLTLKCRGGPTTHFIMNPFNAPIAFIIPISFFLSIIQ